jgi:NADH-quinone oxidoreductase subunit M
MTSRDWAPVVPLVVLMVWLGCYTQSFLPPISSATSHLLQQTKMNEEYRVQVALPHAQQIAEVSHAR